VLLKLKLNDYKTDFSEVSQLYFTQIV